MRSLRRRAAGRVRRPPGRRPTCGRFSRTCCADGACSPERIDEVAHHYERFGGVSPLTELTLAQAGGARDARCAPAACRCPCTSGCATGIRISPTRWPRCRAPASGGRSACWPPRSAAIRGARSIARTSATRGSRCAETGAASAEITYVGDWHEHPGFIEANADHVRAGARSRCPWIAGPTRGWSSPRTASRPRWRSAIRTRRSSAPRRKAHRRRSRCRRRLGARLSEPERPSRGSVARAGRLRLPARASTRTASQRGRPLPGRLSLRSRRSALRPRRRGGRDLPRRSASPMERAAGGERASRASSTRSPTPSWTSGPATNRSAAAVSACQIDLQAHN